MKKIFLLLFLTPLLHGMKEDSLKISLHENSQKIDMESLDLDFCPLTVNHTSKEIQIKRAGQAVQNIKEARKGLGAGKVLQYLKEKSEKIQGDSRAPLWETLSNIALNTIIPSSELIKVLDIPEKDFKRFDELFTILDEDSNNFERLHLTDKESNEGFIRYCTKITPESHNQFLESANLCKNYKEVRVRLKDLNKGHFKEGTELLSEGFLNVFNATHYELKRWLNGRTKSPTELNTLLSHLKETASTLAQWSEISREKDLGIVLNAFKKNSEKIIELIGVNEHDHNSFMESLGKIKGPFNIFKKAATQFTHSYVTLFELINAQKSPIFHGSSNLPLHEAVTWNLLTKDTLLQKIEELCEKK